MAPRRVSWAKPALEDLQKIRKWLKKHDAAEKAKELLQEFRAAAATLAELPHRGRVFPLLRRPELRELIIDDYRLVYRVLDEEVQVLNVFHQRQNIEALLEEADWG